MQISELFTFVCVSLCTTVVHNTAQNSSDYFPAYPPDNRHSSDAVYWKGREGYSDKYYTTTTTTTTTTTATNKSPK